MNAPEYGTIFTQEGYDPAALALLHDIEFYCHHTQISEGDVGRAMLGDSGAVDRLRKDPQTPYETVLRMRQYLVAVGGPVTALDAEKKVISFRAGDFMQHVQKRDTPDEPFDYAELYRRLRCNLSERSKIEQQLLKAGFDPNVTAMIAAPPH